jgi:hypothetical protein
VVPVRNACQLRLVSRNIAAYERQMSILVSQELWEQTQQRSRASSRLPLSDPPQAGRCWLSTKKRDSSAILMNRPLTGILSKIDTMGIQGHLEPLCPDSAAWRICRIAPAQDRMVSSLEPMRTAVACPVCGTDSGHVHSHFPRGDHQPWCVALLPLLPQLSRCRRTAVRAWDHLDV